MKGKAFLRTFLLCLVAVVTTVTVSQARPDGRQHSSKAGITKNSPQLVPEGGFSQLYVDGKPFLVLGGELLNSSSSSLSYMDPIWTHMNQIHANTVLTPVSWDMTEPVEGRFDFRLVDGLIEAARKHNLRLVFLWLASWKNRMSSYMPLWMKRDASRFPRAERADGSPMEVLSTLSDANRDADCKAFAALMKHVRNVDSTRHTVMMVQVENEVGILGDSRDRSAAANESFGGAVPSALMNWLGAHKDQLNPEFRKYWDDAGGKPSGTWREVFGEGAKADQIFMAWNYSRYVDAVAAAGKAAYGLPMYANCWLDGSGAKPGDFPSGCPESDMMDVWQAGAPHLDLLAPDLYASNFQERCDLYTRRGNTLFLPEMNSDSGGAMNIFYAIGQSNAIGTSPFGIDHTPIDSLLSQNYQLLQSAAPEILQARLKGQAVGFVFDSSHPSREFLLNGYKVKVSLDSIFGHTTSQGYGILMADGPDQFMGVGSGFRVSYTPLTPGPKYAGIGRVIEGSYQYGRWVPGRTLNGDETDQGWGWRFPFWSRGIEKCVVYRYQ